MVLYLRRLKIILAILILLILSVTPTFALDEEVEEDANPEIEISAETQPSAQESDNQTQTINQTQVRDKTRPEFVVVYFYDEQGVKILEEEKIEISKDLTAEEFVKYLADEMETELEWKQLEFKYNDKKIEAEDEGFKKQKLKDGDEITIQKIKDEDTKQDTPTEEKSEEILCVLSEELSIQATDDDIKSSSDSAAAKVKQIISANNWVYGNEWGIIGITRLEEMSGIALTQEEVDSYCSSLATELASRQSAVLGSTSSDNSRTVIALTALGYDPINVNGYNLLQPLANYDYVTKLRVSGPAWALIALDSNKYDIPVTTEGTQNTREKLIKNLLDNRTGDGWTFSGTSPDVDMTCMAIEALAPYCNSRTDVGEAVAKAVDWLSSVQQPDGSYKSYGNSSSESSSQVIVALTSIGVNPNTDSRFIKNGFSVVDSLLSFKTADGGFKHLATDSESNVLATYQGCYGLTAYQRLINNKSSLFDISGTTPNKFDFEPYEKKDADNNGATSFTGKGLSLEGRTFSLGGKTITLEDTLKADGYGASADAMSIGTEYNNEAVKNTLKQVLPWIYIGIGALALIGLILVLRNRKSE